MRRPLERACWTVALLLALPCISAFAQEHPAALPPRLEVASSGVPDATTPEGARQLNEERIRELEREHAAIDTRGPWNWIAAGAVMIVLGNGVNIHAVLQQSRCEERNRDRFGQQTGCPDAGSYELLSWLGFVGSATGGAILGVAIRQLRDRRRKVRQLEDELLLLRGLTPQASLPGSRHGLTLGFTWTHAF